MPPRWGWNLFWFGVLQICRAGRRWSGKKRWRATALQDAGALTDDHRAARSVVECTGPPALWAGATPETATGTGALPYSKLVGDDVRSLKYSAPSY